MRYPQLDLVRGLAALLVAVGHWRNLFFTDYSSSQPQGIFSILFYFLTGLGHQAVVVFFVLSGFVIANTIRSATERGTWSFHEYLVIRLTRLWVVLIPAIALGGVLDKLGGFLSNGGIYYCPGFAHMLQGSELNHLGFATVLGNIFFVQTLIVPTLGTNGPLWSLANEFWYYVLFPLFLLALKPAQPLGLRIVRLALGIAILRWAGPGIGLYFLIWLMGCAVYYAVQCFNVRTTVAAALSIAGFAGGSICLVVFKSHRLVSLGAFVQDALLAVCVATCLFGISKIDALSGSRRIKMYGRILSQASYSLYLLHVPFLVFMASLIFKSGHDRWNPDALHLCRGGVILLACALYVLLVYRWTEARTVAVRESVLRLVRQAFPASVVPSARQSVNRGELSARP